MESDCENSTALTRIIELIQNSQASVYVITIEKPYNKQKMIRTNDALIQDILIDIGIPPNVNGYSFIVKALQLISENQDYLNNVTKKLYNDIAKECNSTPARVERNIRHAIAVGFTRGNTNLINSIFGWTIDSEKGSPTNSQFLSCVFYYIQSRKAY